MSKARIKVLVVDDTAVTRMLLVHLLGSDPQIQVVGTVNDGEASLEFVQQNKPDMVLMDIHMPRMDGFEATRRIMETQPLPIVICTATADPNEVATTFRLMEAGAVACVAKPVGREHPQYEAQAKTILQTVKLMSEVKVVRRWARSRFTAAATPAVRSLDSRHKSAAIQLVGIGASTGGPPVLQSILAGLPKDFGVPVLIVQHITHGFLPGLVDWLNQTTALHVHVASHGAVPLPGHVYLAPDDFHLGVSAGGHLVLAREDPEQGLRPAVAYLFRALAQVCGRNAIGVLLSGMGRDGAVELKLMKDRGAYTIAQDRETSVVHGMPGAAIELDGASQILPADRIADALITLARRHLPALGAQR